MKTAFTSISLLTVVIGITGFFFVMMNQAASGDIVPAVEFGKDASKLGIQALLPLSLVFLFVYFSRAFS